MFRSLDLKGFFTDLARSVADVLESTVLVFLYSLFILIELRLLPAKLTALFPNRSRRQHVLQMMQRIDRDIHTYLGVKTAVSLTSAILAYSDANRGSGFCRVLGAANLYSSTSSRRSV